MFDVGDIPLLTFGNCVLKTGVIRWPMKLYVCFYVFFQNQKNMTLLFLSCYTRFLQLWSGYEAIGLFVMLKKRA